MPRIKLTKSTIDALSTPSSDVVYWDAAYPGFGVKVTHATVQPCRCGAPGDPLKTAWGVACDRVAGACRKARRTRRATGHRTPGTP